MTEDEWQPLPPDERKSAEKRLKQDKILLERGFKKGQFTREYCIQKVKELQVKYGLVPPELSEIEIAELDAELDAVLEERKKVLEGTDWEDLNEEEMADAEVKLLKEKKALNLAFKLGKITREQCLERAEKLEVELGLIKPPEDFDGVVTEADLEDGPVEEWVPLDPEEQEIAQKLLNMDKKLLDKAFKNGELSAEQRDAKVLELKIGYRLVPTGTLLEEGPSEPAEGPPEPVEEPPEPAEGPSEPAEGPSEPEEDIQDEWDTGAVGGDVVPTADEEVFEHITITPGEEAEQAPEEGLDELTKELEDIAESYDTLIESIEDLELEAPEQKEEAEPEAPEIVEEEYEPEAETVEEEYVEDEPIAEPAEEYEEEKIPEPIEEPEPVEEYVEETYQEEIYDDGTVDESGLKQEQLMNLTTIPGVGQKKAEILYDAGFRTIEEVQEATEDELSQIMGPKTAASIFISLKTMIQVEEVQEPEEEPELEVEVETRTEKEVEDQASMEEADEIKKDIKFSKTLLYVGIVLCLIGVISVFGLRLGIVQDYIFGDPNAYPGVGYVEPSGHIVSLIPLVIGLVAIVYWGFKNDPLYYELKRIEEEVDELDEDELYIAPSEVVAPAEDIQLEIDAMGKALDEERAKMELEQAENERVRRCEKMLSAAFVLFEDRDRLHDLIPTGVSVQDFTVEVKTAVERRKTHEFTADENAEVLADDLVSELAALDDIIESDEAEDDSDDVDVDDIISEIEDLEDF